MDAISATIVDDGRAQIPLDRVRGKLINFYINLMNQTESSDGARPPTPWVVWVHQIHAAGGGAAPPPWWWCLLVICAFCVSFDSWLVSRTCPTYVLEVLQSVPSKLVPYLNSWMCSTRRCTPPCTAASTWQSKWPAIWLHFLLLLICCWSLS